MHQQIAQNSMSMTATNLESRRSQKGIEYFLLLGRLVDEYVKSIQSRQDTIASPQHCFSRKDERLERIQKINSFVEQFHLHCDLAEDEKNDYLGESLQIIKKIRDNHNRNDIETRSKRLSGSSEIKVIQQVEMSVVQNMVELILLKMTPAKRNQQSINRFLSLLIEQIYELKPFSETADTEKQKTKKNTRKPIKDRSPLECFLESGGKIDVIWFVMFRLLQKNLEEIHQLFNAQKQEKGDVELADVYDKYVNRMIKQVIADIILDKFSETNLLKQFLKAIVQNIHEMELPIVPFFLKATHQLLEQQFKLYYKISFDRDHAIKIINKELYSLENIQTLLEIIDRSANNTVCYDSSKIQTTISGVCSYCGVSKINSFDRLIYQRIAIKINERQNLIANICQQCCQSLNVEPSEDMNLMAFAPLIMSRFWKEQIGKERVSKMRLALRGLLVYHEVNQLKKGAKKTKGKAQIIKIKQKVAMNNSEEAVPQGLLVQIYNYFLFRHAILSTKNILTNLLQITTIFWNSKDDKARQRSIKLLNRPYITSFLLDAHNSQDGQKKELSELSQRIIKCLHTRLRDSQIAVSLASLEFLGDLFSRGEVPIQQQQIYFDSICLFIEEQVDSQYNHKIYEILEKILLKLTFYRRNEQQNDLATMRCFFRTFRLVVKILLNNISGQHSTQNTLLSDQISKLFHAVLRYSASLSEIIPVSSRETVYKQVQLFLVEQDKQPWIIRSLQQFPQKLVGKLLSSVKLQPYFLKSLSFLTVQSIRQLLLVLDSSSCSVQYEESIQHNLCLLIDIIFQDVLSLSEQICTRRKKESVTIRNCKFNSLFLREYLNSSSFIELLLKQVNQESQTMPLKEVKLPGRARLQILNKLLFCNIVNNIMSGRRQLVKYMNIWSKNRKSSSKTIDQIMISSSLETRLEILSEALLQALKSSDIDDLQLQASLLINIKLLLEKTQDFKRRVLVTYEKYTNLFFQKYLILLSHNKNKTQRTRQDDLFMSYLSLNRCLHITTLLVVKLEAFLVYNVKIEQFYEREIASMTDGLKQTKLSSYDQDQNKEVITTSERFRKLYALTLSVLESSGVSIKSDQQLFQSFKKMILLLRYFWQVHPKSIFIDNRLTTILKEIDQSTDEGFVIIKSMYKLFQSLLPCDNIELLSFIREQFARRFHNLMRQANRRNDCEFIETCYDIIFYLLKSGMEGLYHYNKYVFYGLLSPSSKVNNLTSKIIKEVYTRQTSEKALFVNLMESIEFCLETLYRVENKDPEYDVVMSLGQQERLQVLSELTRMKATVFLKRDRRQIKMKSTFVKKVGDLLDSDLHLIKNKPELFILFMKILKSQKVLDYIELSQISFTLNKIVIQYHLPIEEQIVRCKACASQEDYIQYAQFRQILAYRELLSCLAYFIKYQEVTQKIKNYESLFDQNCSPYTQLNEAVPLAVLQRTDSIINRLDIVEQEVNIFWNIILGQVECVVKTDKDWQYQDQNSGSSNNTTLTKAKMGKKVKNQPKRKKQSKHSVSVDKFNSNSTSETTLEVDSYKTRLRNKTRKNYADHAEC